MTLSGGGLFADRNFRLYTIASVTSWLSFFVQSLAVSWLAWDLTHSPLWLGIITFLDTAPYFILGPWGSVLADRRDRHRILYLAYHFALAQSLLLALTSITGTLDIVMLGALAFMHGTVHAFGVPAGYGLLPRAVDKNRLPAAIAFSSSYRTLAMFAGPALAGLVLAYCPVYVAFLVNALGYLVYLTCLRMMRLPPASPAAPSGKSFYGDFIDGLHYSLTHPFIGMLLVLTFFNDGLRLLTTRLLPVFADRLFSVGTSGLALLAGATGIGAAATSVWLTRSRSAGLTERVILWGFATAISATVLFVATGQVWVALAARVLFGIGGEAALTGIIILLQGNVDERYRSRVMGLAFLVSQLSNATLLVVGPLAEQFGVDAPIYVFCAMALVVLVFFQTTAGRKGRPN